MLQKQSLPISRTDSFDRSIPGNNSILMKQSHWPHVVHGAFCFTNQAPNADGSGEVEFMEKPELHMWVGSNEASNWMGHYFEEQERNSGGLCFQPIIHTNFDSYFDGFRSDSARSKEAPPRSGGNTL